MDVYGIFIAILGILVWLYGRGKKPRLATFGMWIFGVGCGIIIGAVGAALIVSSIL